MTARTGPARRVRVHPALVVLVGIVAGWAILAIDQPAYLLPGPLAVGERLWDLAVVSGEVWFALGLSLSALVAGAALALGIGAPLGIAMGANRTVERVFAPYMNGLYVAPVSALTPLFVWWFGIGLEPRIATVFVFSAPIIALTCFRGARETPRTLVEVAHVFGATRTQVMRKTIIPHAIPYIVTALRLGLGRAVKGTVLAELVVSITGLGELLSGFATVFDSASLIAVLIVLLVLGVVLQIVVARVEVAIAPVEAFVVRVRVASLVGLIAIWWLLSLGASRFGLPGPTAVLDAFLALVSSGRLASALGVTLSSFVVGATMAVTLGVPLGILMGFRPWLGRAIDPYLTALYVMPFSAIVPLLVLWFGIDEQVRIVFIFLFTLPQVAIVCYQGARSTPTTLIEVARTYMASERQIFRKVLLPYEVPFIFTALRLGVGLAIQGMVVSELLIASLTGIGYLIEIAGATLDLATVLAIILVVMLLGITAVAILQRIENSVAPWRQGVTIDGGETHA